MNERIKSVLISTTYLKERAIRCICLYSLSRIVEVSSVLFSFSRMSACVAARERKKRNEHSLDKSCDETNACQKARDNIENENLL